MSEECPNCGGHSCTAERNGADATAEEIAICRLRSKLRASELECERLRKLFDDAGQGEYNVLALVDHYQDESLRKGEEAARLRREVEDAVELFRCRAALHRGETGYFFELPGGAVAPVPSVPTVTAAARAAVEYIEKERK